MLVLMLTYYAQNLKKPRPHHGRCYTLVPSWMTLSPLKKMWGHYRVACGDRSQRIKNLRNIVDITSHNKQKEYI